MKTFHVYTDASSKDTSMFSQGSKRTTKVGVIVVNSCIVDIYYNKQEKYINSYKAELQAVLESINYIKEKYNSSHIIIHTDCSTLRKDEALKGIKVLYVRGHCPNRDGLKYKFNCLADWISRNGINTWKEYYYRHLLKNDLG